MAFSATDRTVAPDMNFESCSTWLTRSRFRNAISPSSGVSSAAKIRNKVDLPEPFGPMRPMRSPSVTVNETFWKRGFDPKAFEIPWALMIGGNGCALLDIYLRDYQETRTALGPARSSLRVAERTLRSLGDPLGGLRSF